MRFHHAGLQLSQLSLENAIENVLEHVTGDNRSALQRRNHEEIGGSTS
jgi:hypothetical protein